MAACVHWLTEEGKIWLKFDCHLALMLDSIKFDDLTLIESPEAQMEFQVQMAFDWKMHWENFLKY